VSLASGYARQHIISQFRSRELGRVAAVMASSVKTPCVAWFGLLSLSSVWTSACGHTVRGMSESRPAINQIQN